jgi:hypothetical protein
MRTKTPHVRLDPASTPPVSILHADLCTSGTNLWDFEGLC